MTSNTPWQVRCFRTLVFTGICGLACGSMIGRPVYFLIGAVCSVIGAVCQIGWHLTRSRS